MSKWLRIAVVVVVLLAAWGWSEWGSDSPSGPSGSESSLSATVVRVSDGDTIVVRTGSSQEQRVRLVGIDTPEVFGEMIECGAIDASTALKSLLPAGTRVTLVEDERQGSTDQFGRWLRYVELDGVDLGRQQVLEGNAEIYRSASFDRSDAYRQAAGNARADGRGIWGSCG